MHVSRLQLGRAGVTRAADVRWASQHRVVVTRADDDTTVVAIDPRGFVAWRQRWPDAMAHAVTPRRVWVAPTRATSAARASARIPGRVATAGAKASEKAGATANEKASAPSAPESTATLRALGVRTGTTERSVPLPSRALALRHVAPYVVVHCPGRVLLVHERTGTVDSSWVPPRGSLVDVDRGPGGLWLWFHSADEGHLSAVAVADVRCSGGACRPKPRWRRAFLAKPASAGRLLCGQALPRVTGCVSATTGETAWLDYGALTPWRIATTGGLLTWGRDERAAPYLASVDPGTRSLRWRRPLAGVRRVVHRGDTAAVWTAEGVHLLALATGASLGQIPAPPAHVSAVATAGREVIWLLGRTPPWTLASQPLTPAAADPTADPTAAQRPKGRRRPGLSQAPPWLRPGLTLHYLEVHFASRDPRTGGLVGARPATRWRVTVRALDPRSDVDVTPHGGRGVRRKCPAGGPRALVSFQAWASKRQVARPETSGSAEAAAAPEGGTQPAPAPAAAPSGTGRRFVRSGSAFQIGAADLHALGAGGHAALEPGGSALGVRLDGAALHRFGFVAPGKTQPAPRDVAAWVLRDEGSQRRYLVAPWAKLPVVVRVDSPTRLLLLTAVVAPR